MSIFFFVFSIFMGAMGFGTMLYMINKQGKPNNGRLLGVMLPVYVRSEPEVLKAVSDFKKSWYRCLAVFSVLYIPCLVLPIATKLVSVMVMYLILWFIAFILTGVFVPFSRANGHLMELKHKNGWYCGATHSNAVCVDTEASRLKNQKAAPAWLIAAAAAVDIAAGVLLLLFGSRIMRTAIIIALASSLLVKAVCLLFYRRTLHLRAKTFSQSSEINIAVNSKRQRVWTWVWVLFALTDSVCFALSWAFIGIKSEGSLLFMTVTGLEVIVTAIIIFSAISKLNRFIAAITDEDKAPLITDDDDYWKWGVIYCNPNDPSTMVEKRFGAGFTFNFGNAKGKAWGFGLMGLGAAAIIGVGVLMFAEVLPLEMSVPVISVSNSAVDISYHEYSRQFAASDIKSVSLIESMPDSTKTNGIGTSEYSRGHYDVDGYGSAMLYIYNSDPPYILISLKSGDTVIYNENTRDKTMQVYNELKGLK